MKKEKPVPLHEMELRDFFAAMALLDALASAPFVNGKRLGKDVAAFAYEVAGAMMEERKK